MTGRVAHFNDTSNCSIMSYASLCLLSFAARLSARLYNSIHSFFFRVCGIVAAGRSWPAGAAAGARPASLWRARPACAARPPLQSSLRRPRRLLPGLKGSIGEGSNHSNFSDRSSVRILSKFTSDVRTKFRNFR